MVLTDDANCYVFSVITNVKNDINEDGIKL